MRSTLEEFFVTLDELDAFVKSIEPVNALLGPHQSGVILRYLRVRRRLDYAALIVGIYAAFEKFVEDLIWSLSDVAATTFRYVDLPERLRGKHLRQSGELLAGGRLGEGRYAGFTDASVVANLHGCLAGINPYRLNRPAVTQHDTNLRAQIVAEVFAAVGVEQVNEYARRAQPLIHWYSDLNKIDPPEDVPCTLIELRLTNLVDRRNQITHNGGNVADILGTAEMDELLQFVRAYGNALFHVVAGLYLDRHYLKAGAAVGLGRSIEGPFQDGRVVVVAKPSAELVEGQAILGQTAGRVDRWGTIEELQVDGNRVERVDAASGAASVGIRLNFKASDSSEIFLMPSKDALVWDD